jgi:hypothetical protein
MHITFRQSVVIVAFCAAIIAYTIITPILKEKARQRAQVHAQQQAEREIKLEAMRAEAVLEARLASDNGSGIIYGNGDPYRGVQPGDVPYVLNKHELSKKKLVFGTGDPHRGAPGHQNPDPRGIIEGTK